MTPVTALKATAPIAFFGYAIAANLALFNDENTVFRASVDGALNGKITQEIDTVYRERLPHKDPAIGLIGAVRYLLLDEGRSGVVVGRNGTLFTSEEFRTDPNQTYELAVTEIAQVAKQLNQLGINLVIAPLPAKVDLLRRNSPNTLPAENQEASYAGFLTDLKRLGINAVDTRSVLASLDQPFLRTDTHWTPEGAAAVADYLSTTDTIEVGDEDFVVTNQAKTTFTGDLVSYVTTASFAPMIGLHSEIVQPYQAIQQTNGSTEVDIFGTTTDGSPTIDLVGTSYSANPNWSFAEALKIAMRRDVINHAEEGQGPFEPMRAYLAQINSAETAQDVVWEIPVRYLTDPNMVAKKLEGKV